MNNEDYTELKTTDEKSIHLTSDALSLLTNLIYDPEGFSRAFCQLYKENFGTNPTDNINEIVYEKIKNLGAIHGS